MLDGCQRAGTGTAIKAGDGDVIGMRLGDTGGHRTNTHFRDQLDADVGLRIGIFQIVDQLCQVFNGVNVVMWRRRNQADTGG